MNKKFAAPYKKNNRFMLQEQNTGESILWDTLPLFIKSQIARIKLPLHETKDWIEQQVPHERSQGLIVTWIGHASFLIQIAGVNILTDPVFGGIVPFFPRMLPAGIPAMLLPSIDYILISHNHRDHMDTASLLAVKRFSPNVQVLVPQGDKQWFDRRGFVDAREYVWWQQIEAKSNAVITFLPSIHWSQRGLFDKNKSLWGSWLIQAGDSSIYFAGDTAYGEHFKEIAASHQNIQAALLPIGPCEPHDWMKRSHTNAEQAVQAFLDLQAQHFIPMHWGTFGFGNDAFDAPITRLSNAWRARTDLLYARQLHTPKVGQRLTLSPQSRHVLEREQGQQNQK